MRTYIVDSNFFIEAHRRSYPLDVVPSFWNKIGDLANRGVIISIDKVKAEIYRNEDDLKGWCMGNLPHTFFQETSNVLSEYGVVVNWAASRSNHFMPQAISDFLKADVADVGFLLQMK